MKIKNVFISFLIITSMLMSNVYAAENVKNIYVSATTGSDTGDGSLNAPLKTLQAANDMVAEIKDGYSGVNVNIMAGTYNVSDLQFGEANSGSAGAEIVWKAYNNDKVVLTAEQKIENARITDVNTDAFSKIPSQARGNVKQVILTSEEIEAIGKIRYTGQRAGGENAPAYLAQNGKMYEIAGYPNKVNMDIVKSKIELTKAGYIYTIEDERVNRWSDVKDAYLVGNPTYEWYEDTLKIANISGSKITTSEGGQYHIEPEGKATLRIVNLVEEIDYPGEFYIDRKEGYLYFYPIDSITGSTFSLVTSQKPLMTIEKAKYISFENLIFEGTCSTGVIISESNNITLKGCELKNIGKNAVEIKGSKYTTVTESHIHDIGKTAIIMSGGDYETLTSNENIISNCHIEKYGRILHRNASAISTSGVGDKISHNRIHNADHSAISFSESNNILIEYNDIYDVLNSVEDAGAIYAGRSWVDGGTEIKYNYIHDNPYSSSTEENYRSGVYLDDSFAGTTIFGNVFANMNAGVKLHASNYNDIQNNVFINLKSSIRLRNSNGDEDEEIDEINKDINKLLEDYKEEFKSQKIYEKLSDSKYRGAYTLYKKYFDKYDPWDATGKYDTWNTEFPYLKDYVDPTNDHMSPQGNVIKYNATYTGGQTQLHGSAIYLASTQVDRNNELSSNLNRATSMDVNNIDYTLITSAYPSFQTIDIREAGIEDETSLTLNDFGVVYPQDQANVELGSQVLIWDDNSGAEKYHLVVSKNANLSSPIVDEFVEGNFYELKEKDLTAGETYYWTVDAVTNHYLYTNKTKRMNEDVVEFTVSQNVGVVTLSNIVYRNGDGNKINAIENSSVNVVEFDLINSFSNDINAVATLKSFDGNGLVGEATVTKDVKAYETIKAGVGIMTSADSNAYMTLTINCDNGSVLEYRIDNAAMAGQAREDKLAITSVTIGSGTIVKGATNAITAVVKSLADGQQNVRCIMATYDSNHKLVDSDTVKYTMLKDDEQSFNVSADVSSDANAYVKLFFWNDKMQPLVTDYDVQ